MTGNLESHQTAQKTQEYNRKRLEKGGSRRKGAISQRNLKVLLRFVVVALLCMNLMQNLERLMSPVRGTKATDQDIFSRPSNGHSRLQRLQLSLFHLYSISTPCRVLRRASCFLSEYCSDLCDQLHCLQTAVDRKDYFPAGQDMSCLQELQQRRLCISDVYKRV